MKARAKKENDIESKLDDVSARLVDELLNAKDIAFSEKISAFKALVTFWAAKHRMSADDEVDPFTQMRERLSRAEKEK